jgi:hypothetical protein
VRRAWALEPESARLRAERDEVQSLRAGATKAEAELARQTATLHGCLKQGEEEGRWRLKRELDARRPVAELLTTEAKRHRAYGRP